MSPAPAPKALTTPQEADRPAVMGQSTHHPLESRTTCQRSAARSADAARREGRNEELAAQQPRLRDEVAGPRCSVGKSRWRRQPWQRGWDPGRHWESKAPKSGGGTRPDGVNTNQKGC